MKKLWKYIVGFFSFVGGILTLFLLSSNKNKKVKEIKKNIKDNEKKTKAIDKQIDASKETDVYLKKALENKKKSLKKVETKKKIPPKKKTASKARSKLKKKDMGKLSLILLKEQIKLIMVKL